MDVSEKGGKIRPSATLALNAKAKEMAKAGKDVINLAVGEPDFPTPENICRAAIRAINEGFTKYTPAEGIAELREAIARKLMKDNGLKYQSDEIIVSNGTKHSIYTALQAVLNQGDQVVMPSPCWVSYSEQVMLAGGVPVFAGTLDLDTESMEKSITEKTKAIIINTPNNPTGAVYSKEALKAVAQIAVARGIFMLSDEIYEKLVYGKTHHSMAEFAPHNTIVLNGLSKSYAMTGWRMGYAAGPARVIKAMSNIQSHTTGSINSITQKAAIEALAGPQDSVEDMRKAFEQRRDFVAKRLDEMGLPCANPEGAFYAFPDISEFGSSSTFSSMLLENAGVAVVPGIEFGSDKHIRISYATSMQNLEKAMERIEKTLNDWEKMVRL